jgi:hypothetical protein
MEGSPGVDKIARAKLSRLLILSVAVLSAFVFACGGGADDPEGGAPGGDTTLAQGEELPTIAMPARWATGDADRLDSLIASADAVFRGKVVALKGQRTTLSQPGGGEPGAPAPRFADTPVSQFEVSVESVLSGNLTPGTAVILEQLGGVEIRQDGTQVRIMLEGDEPIEAGQTYLFFGTFQEDGTIVAAPFGRMKVQPDGSLVAEAGWGHLGALAELSRRNLGDAERQISVTAGD